MTKEETIKWLEETIEKYMNTAFRENDQLVVNAIDLLASLNGWKVQHCSRQNRPMRDSRLDLIGKK